MKKKWMFVIPMITLAILLSDGCGSRTKEEAIPDENSAGQETEDTEQEIKEPEMESWDVQAAEQEETVLKVELEEKEKETVEDEEGNILLVIAENIPQMTFSDSREAEEKFNMFFLEKQAGYQMMAREYAKAAGEDLEERQKEGGEFLESWNGYELGLKYTIMRVDEQMISIVEDGYEYTGGAHPNAYRVAYNFDTQTGEVLSLENAVDDLDEAMKESNKFLKQYLTDSKFAEEGVLFKDYVNHIGDILTDNTWYTDKEGFHIICNEYIITPHAAGILEFVMPYGEHNLLKEEYVPTDNQSE